MSSGKRASQGSGYMANAQLSIVNEVERTLDRERKQKARLAKIEEDKRLRQEARDLDTAGLQSSAGKGGMGKVPRFHFLETRLPSHVPTTHQPRGIRPSANVLGLRKKSPIKFSSGPVRAVEPVSMG